MKAAAALALTALALDAARAQPPGADGQAKESGGGGQGNTYAACTKLPCQAALLGDVALTTVGSVDGTKNLLTGKEFAVGENIYGPYEAGFGERQENILKGLGCTDSNVADAYIDGGIDTATAESIVAAACGVTLPRTESNGDYISLIDECGGHTKDYHFHERLSCLYKEEGTHSAQIGEGMDGKGFYGKWEDYSADTVPKLDSCGGHFGVTPDSNGKKVYHYHVQEKAPFTIGCFGPDKNDKGEETLVTLEKCRSLYSGCTSTPTTVKTTDGSSQYKLWCPCYDAGGSTITSVEHAVFDNPADVTCAECDSGDSIPRTSGQARGQAVGVLATTVAMIAAAAAAAY
jgi:hypothetical protein